MKDSARSLFVVRRCEFVGSRFVGPCSFEAVLGPRRVTLAPHATCLGPGGRDAPATEVGRRQALAVPHLRPLWTPHSRSRLVEPFCGGLAVALGLKPATALLNDANPHLVTFY